MRGYVQGLLSPLYSVEAVADGEQALAAARRRLPDLVLADIMMPRIDGLGLIRSLRADARLRDIPVILLSARAGEESRLEGLDAGADDYLVKPFSARELLVRIGALLELAQMRRQSEQALREREEQLRLATEAAEVGLWDVDLTSDTLYWPPRVKAMFGISPDVPVSMADFYAGLHPADRERTSAAFAAARDPDRRALYEVEYRTVGKEDGLIRWVAAKGRGIFDGDGRCVRVIGTALDITVRKRDEERLREETRVQELLGQMSHSLVGAQLDVQRVVQIATDSATELSGAAFGAFFYKAQDEKGEFYTLYTLSGAPREAFAGFPHPRATGVFGPTLRGEGVVRSADITADPRYGQNPPHRGMPPGHLPVRSYLAVPVKAASGEVLGALLFGHPAAGVFDERAERLVQTIAAQAAVALDNAGLHQASQREIVQRTRMQEALDEANRRKDEFLAMLAHELRNPLSPIGTASELLARTVMHDERAQTAIGMIKRQVAQLTRLVDDLLDVSRITQGRIQLKTRPIDIATVIAQGVETLEPQLREKRHQLSVLASSYEPLYVMGDFARLVQCVGNILTNAVKYTEPGGQISIRTGGDLDSVRIEISDDGPGISVELLPKVFDLFVQSERTLDRSQGGLGVGLAVVKRLVEMHDGEVSARSEGLGRGASFEIRLPRITRPQASDAGPAALKAQPRRVLIVDDNVDAANSLSMLLSLQGHETQVAYGAKEALACSGSFRPDIGLLDIGLPEMDGYELARRLRAMPEMSRLRLVALTGYGQAEDQQRALAAGFDAHLVKPIDLVALERALTEIPANPAPART
jgi:PAS domain S-box-containing protein